MHKFQFVHTKQVFDGAIIFLELLRMKEDKEHQPEKEGKVMEKYATFLAQGKEGDLAIVRYNFEANEIETLYKWREESIVGFTKVTLNSQIWKENNSGENPSPVLSPERRIYDSLGHIRFFYPDNNDQNLESYKIVDGQLKKDMLMIPPPRSGAKEISICCLKYVSFEHEGKVSECVFTAEENSRFGIVYGSFEKLASCKFKELYQHTKQCYAHFILPFKLEKEEGKLIMKLLIGLNIQDTLQISLNLLNYTVLSTNLVTLSTTTLKPGVTNALVFRDGKYIIISTSDFKVKICRTKDYKQIVSLNLHDSYINDLLLLENISDKNEYLFTCSEDRDFSVMDLSSLKKG